MDECHVTGSRYQFVNKHQPITARETGGLLQTNGFANRNIAGSLNKNCIIFQLKKLFSVNYSIVFFSGYRWGNYPLHLT